MKNHNMESNKILKVAEKEMISCKHCYVGTEHLILSLLKNDNISKIFDKYEVDYGKYKKELINVMGSSNSEAKYILYTPLLRLVIKNAKDKAFNDNKEVDEYYLLSSLLSYRDGIGIQIMDNMGVDIESIVREVNSNKFNEYGKCLNDEVSDRVYLRDKEINELMEILFRRNKNNPILIGHAGVGKSAIVSELAYRIKIGDVPEGLKNKKIISVQISSLLAGTKYRGEFEEKVNNLVKECINNKDIILFIDEIHTIMKTGSSDGAIDAGNILKPYLTNGDIKVIGATTISEYNEYIKKDKALLRRFSPVVVKEPSLEDMEYILGKVKGGYESYYNLKIGKDILKYIIKCADKYMPYLYYPDKSIEILDTVCSKKVLNNYLDKVKDNVIVKRDVDNLLRWRIKGNFIENSKLEDIREELCKKYNEDIVKNIINIVKDKKVNKYMYLNGDSDSKVKLVRFVSKKLGVNLIEINCLDYSGEYGLSKIISNNYLYNLIEENPFSFILIKNFDKASREVRNMVNSMISNGYISNMSNEKIYLDNSIMFICNHGAEYKLGFSS